MGGRKLVRGAPIYRKGIRLIFLNQHEGDDGNVNEVRDVGRNPGKSCLFFLTDGVAPSRVRSPWNRFIRR